MLTSRWALNLQVDPASGRSARIGLVVGLHSVEVRKEGFDPYRTQVEIQPARETTLHVSLKNGR